MHQLQDEISDLTIDKSTLDAMLHESLWDLEPDVAENADKYTPEVARLLMPGGKWLYITFRPILNTVRT